MTNTKTRTKNTKGQYHCTQCSAHAYSKCIGQRSIFVNSDGNEVLEGLLSACITYKDAPYPNHSNNVSDPDYNEDRIHTVTITMHGQDDDLTALLFGKFLEHAKQLSPEALERTLCAHDWEIDDDAQCMFGCCRGKDVPKEGWITS